MTHRPTVRNPGDGRTIAVVGDVYRFLATGEETNGKYALWEAIVPPGGGPPPHVHSREEEGFYILDGEITLQIGEERVVASAGMFANMPVGTPHSFRNETDLPAKMLISVVPAGLEQMFFEVGVPVTQGATTAVPPNKDEIERLLAVAPKYGIGIMLPSVSLPDRTTFATAYGGQAPWDIGRPQKAFLDVADRITGSILDAGCGTGENALYFAERGHTVTGIDFLAEPIGRAKQKAVDRGLTATFLVMDALALKDLPDQFETVIDSGLFHVFGDSDRRRYVDGLRTVIRPGGRLFLLCFSDQEPGTHGPRRVSREELHDAFADGWNVESTEHSRYEVRSDLKDISFSVGGPMAWFAMITKRP